MPLVHDCSCCGDAAGFAHQLPVLHAAPGQAAPGGGLAVQRLAEQEVVGQVAVEPPAGCRRRPESRVTSLVNTSE